MRKYLVIFIIISNLMMIGAVHGQNEYNPDAMMESGLSQDRKELINTAINIGEILVGIGLFIQLAYVIKKVQDGLKNSGEIVNWGIAILIYLIIFEIIIKSWVFSFIGM